MTILMLRPFRWHYYQVGFFLIKLEVSKNRVKGLFSCFSIWEFELKDAWKLKAWTNYCNCIGPCLFLNIVDNAIEDAFFWLHYTLIHDPTSSEVRFKSESKWLRRNFESIFPIPKLRVWLPAGEDVTWGFMDDSNEPHSWTEVRKK